MLEIEGKGHHPQGVTRENLQDPRYFDWLRDLAVVTTIYRMEYLLPLQFSTLESYVEGLFASKNDCFFAIYAKQEQEFIGTQRIGHIDWRTGSADLGILIGNRKYWGRGLSSDAIRTACGYAFGSLSLRKMTAGTPPSTPPCAAASRDSVSPRRGGCAGSCSSTGSTATTCCTDFCGTNS